MKLYCCKVVKKSVFLFHLLQVNNGCSIYLITNICISLLGFIRSFVYMNGIKDLSNLGYLTILQTVIMFIGLFQLGLINGGFRLYAGEHAEKGRINDLLFTYFFLLLCILLLCAYPLSLLLPELPIFFLFVSVVIGILTLVQNWLSNVLLATYSFQLLNRANIISSVWVCMLLPLVYEWGILGALCCLFIQPFVFSLLVLKRGKVFPLHFTIDFKLVRQILACGFIPFLSGIFVVINIQLERWGILKLLGTESLGLFYLVFLYSTVFTLLPNSLLSLLFPMAIKAFEKNDFITFKRIIKIDIGLLVLYSLIVFLLTYFLLKPIVAIFFPIHLAGIKYVYYVFPGLVAVNFTHPMSLFFQSVIKLKPILIMDILSLILYFIGGLSFIYFSTINLEKVAFLKSGVSIFMLLGYFIFFILIKRTYDVTKTNCP